MPLNIMILGHAEHGKDEAGKILAHYLKYEYRSSSLFVCEKAVFPTLSKKYGYKTVQECYEDRDTCRPEWYYLISKYCEGDEARMIRELYAEAQIYIGCRRRTEFLAGRKFIDLTIWVDASERKPPESEESCTVTKADADIVLDNNGTVADLTDRIMRLAFALQKAVA